MNQEKRTCQNCHNQFTIEPDDFQFYEKMKVPPPTLCPECRYKRRLLDRNEWSLYRRKCDATGESIVSIYRENVPFPVYKQEYWRSDQWDPLSYGKDFDFGRPFFEQYEELRRTVPHLALVNFNSVNSEYSNQSQDNKDCYMVSATGGSEKCMYGNWFQPGSYFSADCYMIEKSELCYECINCGNCSRCVWSQDCFDGVELSFCADLRGCSSCFGCVGLRNKKYHWFNEQLSKEEYEKRLKGFDWSRDAIAAVRQKAAELILHVPRKFYHGAKAYNSTGDYLENTERARLIFNCRENKETAYLQDSWQMEDCLDMTEILEAKRSYEVQGAYKIYNGIVLRSCWVANDSYYCDMCFSISNCLGCFGLKQKEYCILNKPYPREEYFALKEKIIAHMGKTEEWGEYFPPEHSPFAYNESVTQDFFPLTEIAAKKNGTSWYAVPEKNYNHTMTAKDLPSKILETNESILGEIIQCATQDSGEKKNMHPNCATAFRLTPLEFDLYRKLNIPVPEKCFSCRRTDRFAKRNPRKLWHRQCACAGTKSENGVYANTSEHLHGKEHCPSEFETSYAPDRPEIVYCESCYNSEVV